MSLGDLGDMIGCFALLLAVAVQQSDGDTYNCSVAYQRYPVNSDITINCGSSSIFLSINVCPVVYAMYDPLQLALNGKHNQSNCLGILDTTSSPPVVTYTFPLNDTTQNACGDVIEIQEQTGRGVSTDFSKIQTVVISGFIDTPPSSDTEFIHYSSSLHYNFSCHYPLQYLINNIRLFSSSANVAVNTNNGSFISTLSMNLFLDSNMSRTLNQNGTALPLRTKVYVKIVATNLTTNCIIKDKTTLISNGNGKYALFSFEPFRFIQQNNQKTSTIFLHCVTRLCQPDQCMQFLQGCNNSTNATSSSRRKREAVDGRARSAQGTSSAVTVSSGPIYTASEDSQSSSGSDNFSSGVNPSGGSIMGLIIGLVIAAVLSTGLIVASLTAYKLFHLRAAHTEKKGLDNFSFSGK